MHRTYLYLAAVSFMLSGCMYDYEGAKMRAIATAKQECEHDGKRFVLLKDSVNLDQRDVTVKGACLRAGEELPQELKK